MSLLACVALSQLKEFGDSTELYAEERQADLDSKALEMRKRQEAVPGLLRAVQPLRASSRAQLTAANCRKMMRVTEGGAHQRRKRENQVRS